MRKVVLIFGAIAGVIISIFLLVGMSLLEKGILTFESSEIVGYGSMIIALSMVFFGIKSYRDNYQNGVIKFVKGLQVGLLISLVASLIYAGVWEVYYQTNENVRASFMDKYAEHCINTMRSEGASEAEVESKANELADLKEMYKNPFLRFGFTVLELLPVGILITLISAVILRRKEVLPA